MGFLLFLLAEVAAVAVADVPAAGNFLLDAADPDNPSDCSILNVSSASVAMIKIVAGDLPCPKSSSQILGCRSRVGKAQNGW